MRGAVSHKDGKARLPKQSAAGLFLYLSEVVGRGISAELLEHAAQVLGVFEA